MAGAKFFHRGVGGVGGWTVLEKKGILGKGEVLPGPFFVRWQIFFVGKGGIGGRGGARGQRAHLFAGMLGGPIFGGTVHPQNATNPKGGQFFLWFGGGPGGDSGINQAKWATSSGAGTPHTCGLGGTPCLSGGGQLKSWGMERGEKPAR